MNATMTSEGQVTLPKAVRDMLGIEPGDKVDFRRNEAGEIIMVRADSAPVSRFSKLLGHAGPGLSTDEVMEMTRGET